MTVRLPTFDHEIRLDPGNANATRREYSRAVADYDNALARRPDWAQARQFRERAAAALGAPGTTGR
jgi:hypothetical protein